MNYSKRNKLKTMQKGDLFMADFSERECMGICLEHWGRNSHNEKLYRVFLEGEFIVISEREIKQIFSKIED